MNFDVFPQYVVFVIFQVHNIQEELGQVRRESDARISDLETLLR